MAALTRCDEVVWCGRGGRRLLSSLSPPSNPVAVANWYSCSLPRKLASVASLPSSAFEATLPSATISLGWMSSIWRCRYGRHCAISSAAGARLPGGRHLTMLRSEEHTSELQSQFHLV